MLCTVNLACQMENFPNSLAVFHIWKRVKHLERGGPYKENFRVDWTNPLSVKMKLGQLDFLSAS